MKKLLASAAIVAAVGPCSPSLSPQRLSPRRAALAVVGAPQVALREPVAGVPAAAPGSVPAAQEWAVPGWAALA